MPDLTQHIFYSYFMARKFTHCRFPRYQHS